MTKDELIIELEAKRAKCVAYTDKFHGHELKRAMGGYIEVLDFAIGLAVQLEPDTQPKTQTWDLP